MKRICFIALCAMVIAQGCKKEEPAPAVPTTPPPPTVTVNISLIDVGSTDVALPKMVGVKVFSNATVGDTVFNTTITDWAQMPSFPSNDSTCNATYSSHPSGSITLTGSNDGSYIRIDFYEGATLKCSNRAYYGSGNISSHNSTWGVQSHFVYSPPLITVGW